jgi:hypothetical protein
MKTLVASAPIAFSAAIFAASVSMAQAQATRTWVSGVGDDANPCSRTAPCKTFAGAISRTAAGGFIDVVDPGGFGAVTITKSITIDGSGGPHAGVLASGTNGIIVSGAGIIVHLRNLSIESPLPAARAPQGINGINVITGSAGARRALRHRQLLQLRDQLPDRRLALRERHDHQNNTSGGIVVGNGARRSIGSSRAATATPSS